MAISIEKFRQYLGESKGYQRYKIEISAEDVAIMLEETYKWYVSQRRIAYNPVHTLQLINKVVKWITENRKPGLLLYGTVGSGKTTMALSLRHLLIFFGQRMDKVSALELSRAAKGSEDDYHRYMKSEMLLIDDMGEEPDVVKNFGNEISPIIEIIYHRYDRQLLTIITSNLSDDEMRNRYGIRVSDRFKEMFDRIYFSLESFRS